MTQQQILSPATPSLRARAELFQQTVETRLRDRHGMILTGIDARTMKPYEYGFFDESRDFFRYPGAAYGDFSDYLAYENVGMASSAYLAAMVWKHHATGDTTAMELARRTFHAIHDLYERCQQVESGYYCKCYGDRLSDQVSSDQYVYTLVALDMFASLADPDERSLCGRMIGEMAHWWMRRNYEYPYFGKPLSWPLARFPTFAWLAYRHTGEARFRDEFHRLCALPEVRRTLPFGTAWDDILEDARTREPAFAFEQGSRKRLIRSHAETVGSGYLSLQSMIEQGAPHRAMWIDKSRQLYEAGKHCIGEDGLERGPLLLDLQTHELTEVQSVLDDGSENTEWRLLRFVGWIKSGMCACQFARAAVGIHTHVPDTDALSYAARVLRNINHDQLLWRIDADGKQLPPPMHWVGHTFSGDAVTNWLWAYWEGCARYGDGWTQAAAS